jgi:anti-anti-sigma regulatory factor
MKDPGLDPIWIDVGEVLQRTVTSLYAHLVTRPTGRAVRLAIETQLQSAGERSLSLIDLSEVVIIDFSCADEVVAQLLEASHASRTHEAFFVFRGVHEPHRDQIETVLERRGLAAVAETDPGVYQLLGRRSDGEDRMWGEIERRGLVDNEDLSAALPDGASLTSLLERRLAFRSPSSGRIHALSRLVQRPH